MKIIKLSPVFFANEVSEKIIFINCSVGYDRNINLLFADSIYDHLTIKRVKCSDPLGKNRFSGYRTVKNFKIHPSNLQNYRLVVLGHEINIIELYEENINYTHGIQIDHEKYCFICHIINGEYKNNTKMVNGSAQAVIEFSIGTGVIDIQTNKLHELWVSYNDEAVYDKQDIGIRGLNCFDVSGKIVYTYEPGPYICDRNALNVLSEEEIVFNAYAPTRTTWYAFIKIKNLEKEIIHEWNNSSHILAYSNNKILVEEKDNSFDINYKFSLLDIDQNYKEIEEFEFYNEQNEKLNCIKCQNNQLLFWQDSKLYKIDMETIVDKNKNDA
jgi:hypothetical protein